MGTFLFAHLGVPFLVGLALVFFVAAADREPIRWSSCNDIAVDFGILSMGANGGIFLKSSAGAALGRGHARVRDWRGRGQFRFDFLSGLPPAMAHAACGVAGRRI